MAGDDADNSGDSPPEGKRKATGRPFVKGDPRINRGGRPPLPPEVKEAWRSLHFRALERLEELLDGDNPVVAARVAEIIVERNEGKVPNKMEHTVTKSHEDALTELE